MATTYLSDTQSTPTNNIKWTFSTWIKRADPDSGAVEYVFTAKDGDTNYFNVRFSDIDQLDIQNWVSGSGGGRLITNRKFRDCSAFFMLTVVYDSANGTSGNRIRMYINGVEETSFATDTAPSSSQACIMNANTMAIRIGSRDGEADATNFNGQLAHTHFCDGQAYTASDFGETDSTSGIWVAKTSPSVTYGNNGFFLKYASGASGTDSSGNGNDFTVSGNLTNNKDNPDNNFITLNPLDNKYSAWSFSNSNNTVTMSNTNETYTTSTVGLSKGLWYWEIKITDKGANQTFEMGIASEPSRASGSQVWLGYHPNNYGLYASNGNVYNGNGGTSASYGVSVDEGDIVGVYLDLDASKIYFAKDGVIMNSGTGLAITAVGSTFNKFYAPAIGKQSGASDTKIFDFNFGNGYFGTTAVSSAVADAGGEGQFEYDPSDGGASSFDGSAKDFRAICTNNIATYG